MPSTIAQKEKSSTQKTKQQNGLSHETSQYLIHSAGSPVNWYPWGNQALQKAKEENKLLIVSIGYSACHWCHVMEEQCFDDTAVAAIMNTHFVCIKVDKEERPDIDQLYMQGIQYLTGKAGWPLNAIALPDGVPVAGGTYYEREEWVHLLNEVHAQWSDGTGYFDRIGREVRTAMQEGINMTATDSNSPLSVQREVIIQDIMRDMNLEDGGFGTGARFPHAPALSFVLRTKIPAKEWIEHTLGMMAGSALTDPDDGGFARYTTDSEWIVAHNEKMLYINAQLAEVYLLGYQLSQNPVHAKRAEEVLKFLDRTMMVHKGAYASSLHADTGERDEKIITSWNALVIRCHVQAHRTFGDKIYLQRALGTAKFLQRNVIQSDGSLLRVAGKGSLAVEGCLDDYVYLADAFIQLYQVTLDEQWLMLAKSLVTYTHGHFEVNGNALYRYSEKDDLLFSSPIPMADDEMPSPNAVMARNLLALGYYLEIPEYIQRAEAMYEAVQDLAATEALYFGSWNELLPWLEEEPWLVIAAGRQKETRKALAGNVALQSMMVAFARDLSVIPSARNRPSTGKQTYYACRQKTCTAPATSLDELLKQLMR